MLFDASGGVSAVILKPKGFISFYWNTAWWIQTTPSNAMPELTTSGDISAPTINPHKTYKVHVQNARLVISIEQK